MLWSARGKVGRVKGNVKDKLETAQNLLAMGRMAYIFATEAQRAQRNHFLFHFFNQIYCYIG
jgi:hypothetical protein